MNPNIQRHSQSQLEPGYRRVQFLQRDHGQGALSANGAGRARSGVGVKSCHCVAQLVGRADLYRIHNWLAAPHLSAVPERCQKMSSDGNTKT